MKLFHLVLGIVVLGHSVSYGMNLIKGDTDKQPSKATTVPSNTYLEMQEDTIGLLNKNSTTEVALEDLPPPKQEAIPQQVKRIERSKLVGDYYSPYKGKIEKYKFLETLSINCGEKPEDTSNLLEELDKATPPLRSITIINGDFKDILENFKKLKSKESIAYILFLGCTFSKSINVEEFKNELKDRGWKNVCSVRIEEKE